MGCSLVAIELHDKKEVPGSGIHFRGEHVAAAFLRRTVVVV